MCFTPCIYTRTPNRLTFSFAVLNAAHYYITHVQYTNVYHGKLKY